VDRRRQVLDVHHLDQAGLGRRLYPDRGAAQRPLNPAHHDLVLAPLLRRPQELLAEVIVDGGIRAAPSGARERHRVGARAASPHEQLRARPEEGPLRRAAAKAEAGGKQLAQGAVQRRGVVCARSLDHHLARQDHLLEPCGPYPLHRLPHRLLEAFWGKRALDQHPAGGVRVGERQRSLAKRRQSCHQSLRGRDRVGAGAPDGAQRQVGPAGGAVQSELGHDHERGGKRRPLRRPSAVGREREPPDEDRSGARRQARGLVGQAPPGDLRARSDQIVKSLRSPRDHLVGAAERGEREAVAIRLLPAEPAVLREA
jgi:hypothetical protein